jgi:cyanobactin maturation PatA/PatG family protease
VGSAPVQLVYALGSLGFDFGAEARRDSIVQHMPAPAKDTPPNPYDPGQLLAYLEKNPWDAGAIIWTLTLDSTPIYAIRPEGPFAAEAYKRLGEVLREKLAEGVERISVPGVIAGKVMLMNGQVVPVIQPDVRGMYSWTTGALVRAVAGTPPPESAPPKDKAAHRQKANAVGNFLERVYYEIRNLGVTPQDRALNFTATNAFNAQKVFESAMREEMDLDTIEVERSPICRLDSDCWDVKLLFFFPQRQVQTVRKAHRFTVDVSDIVPVMVGSVRAWFVR